MRRVYQAASQLMGLRVDTLTSVFPSLLPLAHHSQSARTMEHMSFAAGNVTGTVRLPSGDSSFLSQTLPSMVFNGASFDLVLRASPLRLGWRTTVPTYQPSTRTLVSMHARVSGSERQGGVDCWRVDAEYSGMPVTFWIAKDDRRLVHQVMVPRAGTALILSRSRHRGRRTGTT